MLVIVEHRDITPSDKLLFNVETLRSLYVLKVDAAEGGTDGPYGLDELIRILLIDLDVKHIDVGKPLEEHALSFHDRLRCQGTPVSQAEDGGSVGDYRHQITLGRIPVGILRVLFNFQDRLCHSRCICI